MLRYLARRLALGLLTIWLISVASFVIIQLPPGDFVSTYLQEYQQEGGEASQAQAEALRHDYGLDQPTYVQYARWMGRVLGGDFGLSLDWKRPVSDLIGERLWLTVIVSLASVLLTWLIAVPIGVFSAVKQYSVADHAFTLLSFVGLAVPPLLLALGILYFGVVWFNANASGLFSSADYFDAPWTLAKVWDLLTHLPIPGLVLAFGGTAALVRVMRANLLDELYKPYVVTARAKGLDEREMLIRYPVRVALNPFASGIGFLLPEIVSGSVVISLVLSLPTLGPLLLRALLTQDMFLAGAIVLLLGTLTVIGMFLSDLILMWLDPRVRLVA